jgi:hypothetical protein
MTAPAAKPRSTRTAIGCAVLFLLPFAAVGVYATVQLMAAIGKHDWAQAGFLAVFALTFGGVGIGGIAGVLAGRGRAEPALAREARHPAAPWLWREDWAARRVTDSSRAGMWGAWAFTALWNLISIPSAVLAVRDALEKGNYLALIALLFPLVGLGLLAWALRATARYRRYGVSTLELTSVPAPVGHALEGLVRTPPELRPSAGFQVTLSCIRRVTRGSGKNRSTSETTLWQEVRRAPATGVGVPIAFPIPADAVPSDPALGGDRVLWRLDVTAEVPGIDYSSSFEVPVFRTAASEQPRTPGELAVATAFAVPADYRQPSSSPIEVTTTRRGTEIYYPRARNPGMAAGLTAFGLLWGGAVWLAIALHAPLIFPIVFGAFGLLLAFAVLDSWLTVTRVNVGDGRVTVASGWLGSGRERSLAAAEVADVTTRIGSQAGTAVYYDVVLVTAADKRVAAGRGIRDKREAEWLAATIKAALRPGGAAPAAGRLA